jgi:hypothetical protein
MGVLSNIIDWHKNNMGIVIAVTLVLLIMSIFLIGFGGIKEHNKVMIGFSLAFLSMIVVDQMIVSYSIASNIAGTALTKKLDELAVNRVNTKKLEPAPLNATEFTDDSQTSTE